MLRLVLIRLLGIVAIVVVTAVVAFGGIRVLRGDDVWRGTLEDLRQAFGHLQFGAPCGPGASCVPIKRQWELGRAVDVTLLLSGLVAGPWLGLRVGTWAVARGDRLLTGALNAVASFALSLPPYLAGFGLLLIFDGVFGVFPLPAFFPVASTQITPADPGEFARVLLGPALLVALPGFAVCFRLTVATAKEAAGEDYVRTAIAKGLATRAAIARHTRPAARVAVLSFVAASVPFFVTNLVLIEYALNLPGFFRTFAKAAGLAPNGPPDPAADYAQMQAVALWAALLIAVVSAVADIAIGRIDPRVRDYRSNAA